MTTHYRMAHAKWNPCNESLVFVLVRKAFTSSKAIFSMPSISRMFIVLNNICIQLSTRLILNNR